MIDTAFDVILCALILGTAICAVAGRALFGAVVFFIVYGIFIGLAWLRLGAIDVALAEIAVGAGLTGVLLLGAVARLSRLETGTAAPHALVKRLLAGFGAAAVSAGLVWAFFTMPPLAGLQGAVTANLAQSGVRNPVTAVLLNFRGWDTLLECIVLLAALIGVWSLTRNEVWGGRPGLRQHAKSGGVMDSFGRVLPPVGLLLGFYMVWVGSFAPGGAFQGGTVLAAIGLLVMMIGLLQVPHVSSLVLRGALVLGPLVFLVVGLAGALVGQFLTLPPAHAKVIILGIEVVLTLSIAVTLALLVIGPVEERK